MTRVVDSKGHGRMTAALRNVFLAAGCDPACHACGEQIRTRQKFALVEGYREETSGGNETLVEVMVCWHCKDVDLPEKQKTAARERAAADRRWSDYFWAGQPSPGCFVVNGKIVK